MISSLGKQGGRRYPQLRGTTSTSIGGEVSLRNLGQAPVVATKTKFRKTLSELGGRTGARQSQGIIGGL